MLNISAEVSRWIKRLLRHKRSQYANEQEAVMLALLARWWQRIVLVREEGELAAWEGSRIVREQVNPMNDEKAKAMLR